MQGSPGSLPWGSSASDAPQLTAGVAHPLLPLPYPQTTTSLRKSVCSGVRRTWCSFSTRCCLAWPQTSMRKLEWGRSLWKQLGEQGDGPPSTPTSIRSPGTSGLSLFSFHSSFSSSAIDFSLLPKLPLFTLFSSLKSQVQFRQTAFSCPEAKRKRKRKLQTASQSHRRRKTPKTQGKRKTQFLRKRK